MVDLSSDYLLQFMSNKKSIKSEQIDASVKQNHFIVIVSIIVVFILLRSQRIIMCLKKEINGKSRRNEEKLLMHAGIINETHTLKKLG